MSFELLIKNGQVVDGSGSPAFRADIGIRDGKIAQIGKLNGAAKRTIDANGMIVAPGFIDSHCHFDAQVTWDPLCTFSCYHGVTTVVIGNCSLGLAPVRKGGEERIEEFLSYVEAIPMDTLRTVNVAWESVGEYMDAIDRRLGVNVGVLIGHSPVRHYVMGKESQSREARPDEIEKMRALVKEGMEAGALGLSFTKVPGHFDPQGVKIPSLWAGEEELFALSEVLGEYGDGIIQCARGKEEEEKNRLMSRLYEQTGRPVFYNQLGHLARRPDAWKAHLKMIDETAEQGIRAFPCVSPLRLAEQFTMRNTQVFRGVPSWQPILMASDDEKRRAYADPELRNRLNDEALVRIKDASANLTAAWPDSIWVHTVKLDKNKSLQGKSLTELAAAQGKGVIDAFLDLALEEDLDTVFERGIKGFDKEVMSQLLNYPNAYIGLSDAGAHVQFRGGYGYASILLGYWVRQAKIMTLEQAIKRLSFDLAQWLGIYDRGMLRPGLAADIVIFDPETIDSVSGGRVDDLPGGAWRMKETALGVHYTVVNGQVLLENGHHTGALPGRVIRNSRYLNAGQESAAAA